MEYSNEQECIIEADDPEGGWVDTHHYATSLAGLDERVTEMSLEETLEEPSQTHDNADEDEDDEDAADMDAFEISGMLDEQDKVETNLQRKKYTFESFLHDCEKQFCYIAHGDGNYQENWSRETGFIYGGRNYSHSHL